MDPLQVNKGVCVGSRERRLSAFESESAIKFNVQTPGVCRRLLEYDYGPERPVNPNPRFDEIPGSHEPSSYKKDYF